MESWLTNPPFIYTRAFAAGEPLAFNIVPEAIRVPLGPGSAGPVDIDQGTPLLSKFVPAEFITTK